MEQFEHDVKFLQLFFLLVNRSCPIKNVDLGWRERGPSGRFAHRHLGMVEALRSSCSRLLGLRDENPHAAFCQLINDCGRQEARSCALSDHAAADRVGKSGKSEAYRCNFGLVDIAVPVIANGEHIATLYSGQVLREPPTQEGFSQILRAVAELEYIDLSELEKAYWSLPVVTEEDIQNTRSVLEILAEYLSNSCTRLAELVKEQRRKSRDAQLARKEFGYLALEGGAPDRETVRQLMKQLGLVSQPTRVLVVRPEPSGDHGSTSMLFDLEWTSAIQAVEELCERLASTVAVHLRGKGICVFFSDGRRRDQASGDFYAHRLANDVLQAVAKCCHAPVRIGIGSAKADWKSLADSYQEACTALIGSQQPIAIYRQPVASLVELTALSDQICSAIREKDLTQARTALGSLPLAVKRRLGDDLAAQRHFYFSVLNAVCIVIHGLGANPATLRPLYEGAAAALDLASNPSRLHEAFLRNATDLLHEVRRLYTSKRVKIVEQTCRIIQRKLDHEPTPEPISIRAIASDLGISMSHLSRLFRKATGETLEHHVMRKRVELAQRHLLDPRNSTAEVAERCGYSDASYFARVFRKITGCSPREYSAEPLRPVRAVRAKPEETNPPRAPAAATRP